MKINFALIAISILIVLAVANVSAQIFPQFPQPDNQTSSDLLVWVTDYQPSILRSDLLEESDVNIFARIRGIQINPFISIPVVNQVSLRPTTVNKDVSIRGLSYLRTSSPSLDNLGYIVVTIGRISTEDKMPDYIDLNVSAIVDYSYQDVLGFGQKDMTIGIAKDQDWLNNGWKYEFWNNAGYLRLTDLTDQKASITIYDAAKNQVNQLQLSIGQQSTPIFMNVNGKMGWATVTLNSIQTPSPYAVLIVNNEGKVTQSIVRVNYPIESGSEWKVTNLDARIGGGGSVTIRNSKGDTRTLSIDTRTVKISDGATESDKSVGDLLSSTLYVGWITSSTAYIINASNANNAIIQIRNSAKGKELTTSVFDDFKARGVIQNYYTVNSGESIPGTSLTVKSINAPAYAAALNDVNAKSYFDSAITQYKEIYSGIDAAARVDTSIPQSMIKYNSSWAKSSLWRAYFFAGDQKYDQAQAADFLKELISRYPSDSEIPAWQSALNKISTYNYGNAQATLNDNTNSVSVLLDSIEIPESASSASLLVHGAQTTLNEGSVADSEWRVETITQTDVTFRRTTSSEEVRIPIGSEKQLNVTSGLTIKVLSVDIKKEAYVSVKPYHQNGETVTNFTLHVAIEKRGIQLTPSQINEQINNTAEQIKQLDKITADMGKTITGLRNACFLTYTVLTVEKLFTDWSGVKGKATNVVMRGLDGSSGWIKYCENNITSSQKGGIFYRSVQDCLAENKDAINSQVADVVNVLGSTKNIINSSFFDDSGNIKDAAGLEKAFKATDASKDIITAIDNQQYLQSKFGASKLTRNDVESLYVYQQLAQKAGTVKTGIYAESADKLKSLTELYTADNGVVTILQQKIPTTADDFSKLTRNSEKQDRLDRLQLASEYKPAATATVSAFRIDEASGLAYVPSISSTPVAVTKNAEGKWIYTDNSKTPPQVSIIVLQQECANKEKETTLRTYSTSRYKGLPNYVPFPQGWAEVTQYDSNDNPLEMTVHVLTPLANGQCPDIIYNFKQDLNSFEVSDQSVIRSATRCVTAGVTSVKNKKTTGDSFTCEGHQYSIGTQAASKTQQNYCEDFFSRSECNVLYQVCDPVICPPSRCDFGGRFQVANVIQSGIFGSILLCAPNFPTPVIAVCLPGIRAGLMGYESMLQGYQSCLKKQLQTGEAVGVCDRIRSLYWCDLLWKTVLSMYDSFGGFYGIISGTFDKLKGGGEYLTAYSGLKEAENSLNFFASVYAQDVFAKFRSLTTEQIGGYVCQRAIYGNVPTSIDIFADISKVEAPPQFFGHVEEEPYANVGGTPSSHYKVYYHIYSGEASQGAYYKVYFTSPIASPLYTTPIQEYDIDSGFIQSGGFIDKSPDFVAQSGYSQLCIDINGVPYCGFGWVSSEMLVKELTNQYTTKIAASNINSESECVFSTPMIVGNLQSRGINRICTSGDPNSGGSVRTWTPVGWCDQKAGIKCWLDDNSVKGAITDLKLQQETLTDAQKKMDELLKAGYSIDSEIQSRLDDAYIAYFSKGDYTTAITKCQAILKDVSPIQTSLIDEAKFIMGLSYEKLFEAQKKKVDEAAAAKLAVAVSPEMQCSFIKEMTACIDNLNPKTNVPKNVILAVAVHESNYGTNRISQNPIYNYFAIHAVGSQPSAPTTGGAQVRVFTGMCDSVSGFVNLDIVKNSVSNDETATINTIASKGYAEDTGWANGVIARLAQVKTLISTTCAQAAAATATAVTTAATPATTEGKIIQLEKSSSLKVTALVTYQPNTQESLSSIIQKIYLAQTTELTNRIMQFNGLSGSNPTIQPMQGIYLPLYSPEQIKFDSAYKDASCDKVISCSDIKIKIASQSVSNGRAYYLVYPELCYSTSAFKCASCSQVKSCTDLNNDDANCKNIQCTNISNQNLVCSYEDIPGVQQCVTKLASDDYAKALASFNSMKSTNPLSASQEFNKYIVQYPSSTNAFYAARGIYDLAQAELAGDSNLGYAVLEANAKTAVSILATMENDNPGTNDNLRKTLESSNKMLTAYRNVLLSFDDISSKLNSCFSFQTGNCKCGGFNYNALSSSLDYSIIGYDPDSLGKGAIYENPNKQLADFEISFENKNMQVIDLAHGNREIRTAATPPICYFSGKFVANDFFKANYNYDSYIRSIAVLDSAKMLLIRFEAPTAEGGSYFYLKGNANVDFVSSELFNFGSHHVCFVATEDDQYKSTVASC